MTRAAATTDPHGSAEPGPRSSDRWPSRDAFEDPNALGSLIYRAIIRWGGLLVRSYYRVEVRGEPFPTDRPVLLVQNHSNGLADAHFAMASTRRPIRILVKFKLMKAPVIGWMLRRMDAVPMYRKKDGVDTRQNAASFEAIDAALHGGAVITVFPEGESLGAICIRPLKSGVARMAISAERTSDGPLGLCIVPVGVTYEERDRYRSEASAVIGPAFDVAPILEEAGDDQRAAITATMRRVRESLEALTLHAETEEEHRAAVALERIQRRSSAPLGLRRQAALAAIQNDHSDDAAKRRELIEQLGDKLADAGLSGDQVLGPAPSRWAALGPLLPGLPLAALALVVWGVPVAIALRIAPHARTPDKVVTLRLLFSFAGLLLWIPTLAVVLGLTLGVDAALLSLVASAVSLVTFRWTVDALRSAARAVRRRALARSPEGNDALCNAIRSIREAFPVKDPA